MPAKAKLIGPDAPPMEKGVRVGYSLTNKTRKRLEELSLRWRVSMTTVVEFAISSLGDEKSRPVLGDGISSAQQAVCCWTYAIELATRRVETLLSREEWNYLADVNSGMASMTMAANGLESVQIQPTLLWANAQESAAERAHEWFTKDTEGRVSDLVAKLRKMSFVESWAVTLAIQWFWEHHDVVDHLHDRWWSIAHRREVDSRSSKDE